jgi:Uma2 family endonuclease
MYQTDPPRPAKETLPTMYDLPSEDPKEPGLPDEFHLWQPQLLRETFVPPTYPLDQIYTASDLNLYYDVRHPLWYKRPDWFAVVGIPRLYEEKELRLSYVTWQEGVNPFIAIELLSPGTEKEDLGQTLRDAEQPPTKWEVYESFLRVPYYAAFDRYIDTLRVFVLNGDRYDAVELTDSKFWMPRLQLGLGLWQGTYQGIHRRWLRWYDATGDWVQTPVEQEQRQVEQQRQRAEQEQHRVERLIAQLKALGVEPDLE